MDTSGEKRGKILIVEDELPIRLLVETVLGRAGYLVATAQDGNEALQLLQNHGQAFDVLITDLVLPGMNGDDLATAARSLRPDIGVIFASGSFGFEPEELVRRFSGANFLRKPFTPAELTVTVLRCLKG